MIRTAIIYSSHDGQTKKICNRLSTLLKEINHCVELFSIHEFSKNIQEYEKIIIASSIRYGTHHKKILDFIQHNKESLGKIKNAFISVNLVARKPEKAAAETNPYVIKFLDSIEWKPNLVAVFAGKLDYKKYTFTDRLMIQLIMLITKGPVNSKTEIEYTDWDSVDEFGNIFGSLE